MSNIETNDTLNELNNLLQLLAPELNEFKALVRDMAKIDSPYKNEFNHIKVLINAENQVKSSDYIQKTIALLVKELNEFSIVLNSISDDAHVSQLYADEGLLDKCVHFQKNIKKKLGLSM